MLLLYGISLVVTVTTIAATNNERTRRETCPKGYDDTSIPELKTVHNLRAAAIKWAPLVKLHKSERFKPSSVDFFLRHVTLNGREHNTRNLPKCGGGCVLTSKENIKCGSCILPFFHGENTDADDGAKVPTYVMIRETSKTVLDLVYWFFYPYNRGKNVCIGLYLDNACLCIEIKGHCLCPRVTECIGGHSTFAHHVGDWEHVVVRFKNNKLYSMYLSIHDGKVTKKYGGEFLWNGKTFRRKDGRSLTMDECTHARIYSADGSHGMWPNPGKNTYMKLPNGDALHDYCNDGTSWRTWKNLKLFKYRSDNAYTGEFAFMGYEGRWGNSKKWCGIAEKISGECMLNSGPVGPQGKGWLKSGDLG